jgi:hypothetical protein
MERSAVWLIMLVTGCTSQPQPPEAVADANPIVIGAPPHHRPQPLNCGTPYSFKICPVPLMPVVGLGDLPPLPIPMVDIIQLPQD